MSLKIAVVPGDGIGPEVIEAGMRVLEKVNEDSKLGLEFVQFDWNADTYLATGISMPPGAMDDIRENYAAVYLGAFGDPRVPDMKHAADILLGMRFQLDLYVNYRPVKLLDERLCPLKGKSLEDVDSRDLPREHRGAVRRDGGQLQEGDGRRDRDPGRRLHAERGRADHPPRLRVREGARAEVGVHVRQEQRDAIRRRSVAADVRRGRAASIPTSSTSTCSSTR